MAKKSKKQMTAAELQAEKFRRKQNRADARTAYLFLIPWLIGFIIFTGLPLIYTFYLSFNNVTLNVRGWNIAPNGWGNYNTALFRNTEYVPALVSFITMELIYVPSIIVISFILALLLNTKIKFRGTFRMIYFLPVIVLSGSAMFQLMDSGGTMIGSMEDFAIVELLGSFSPVVADALAVLLENFTMVLWFTGIPIVLIINGLQKINPEEYEAVAIDGATSWQTLWKITMPQMREIVLLSTIFTIVQIGSFAINPLNGIITEAIYNTAAGLGLASSYAFIYSLAVFVIMGIAFLFLHRREKQVEYQKILIKRNTANVQNSHVKNLR